MVGLHIVMSDRQSVGISRLDSIVCDMGRIMVSRYFFVFLAFTINKSLQIQKTCFKIINAQAMPPKEEFTSSELEMVISVFKQYETGLREACIDVKVGNEVCYFHL